MSRDKETEQWKYFSKLMDDYKSGKRGVQPGHPKEIEDAIKKILYDDEFKNNLLNNSKSFVNNYLSNPGTASNKLAKLLDSY